MIFVICLRVSFVHGLVRCYLVCSLVGSLWSPSFIGWFIVVSLFLDPVSFCVILCSVTVGQILEFFLGWVVAVSFVHWFVRCCLACSLVWSLLFRSLFGWFVAVSFGSGVEMWMSQSLIGWFAAALFAHWLGHCCNVRSFVDSLFASFKKTKLNACLMLSSPLPSGNEEMHSRA